MTPDAWRKYSGYLKDAKAAVEVRKFDVARTAIQDALKFGPANADHLRSLAGCCFECNRLDEAVAHYRASLALAPDDPASNFQMGICLLLLGHPDPGWAGLAHRKRYDPPIVPPAPAIPAWAGEPLGGKAIVYLREQGLGDVLNFIRYAPAVAASGGRVFLDVPAPLRRLFAAHPEFGTVLVPGEQVQVSAYVYCMDLPQLFGDGPHGPADAGPYLRVPADAARPDLGPPEPGLARVGLAWAGSSAHGRDKLRSIGLGPLRPVLAVPGVRWYSLLVGPRAADPADAGLADTVRDLSAGITDFVELAAAVADLDLVVTVDTAVAHLAGALGKPVWVMVTTPADWRWGATGTTTGWYPSMRLFRQPVPGDWASVVRDVEAALRDFVAAGRPAGRS